MILAERNSRRPGQRSGSKGPREGGGKRFTPHRKVCGFCADKVQHIDYKDIGRLRRYISDRGKIEPRRKMGTCSRHQRRLALALKRARFLGLLAYTPEHVRNLTATAA
jgi:small subunit ribosomal protein S18